MNDGKNGFVGPVLIAAPVIFAEKVVRLQGKSPWVDLYRITWFQFLVPELGGYVCTALHCDITDILCTQQRGILKLGTRAGENLSG